MHPSHRLSATLPCLERKMAMNICKGLGVAMVVASAPLQLTAQTGNIDLSGHASRVCLFHPDGRELNPVASYHMETGRSDSPARFSHTFASPPRASGAWTSVADSMAVLVNEVTGMLTRLTVRNDSLVADTFDLGIRDRHPSETRVVVARNDGIWVGNNIDGQHEEWSIIEPGANHRRRIVLAASMPVSPFEVTTATVSESGGTECNVDIP